ncbi:putative RNA-dependent RNA polymerase SHL2 like protein [Argiope bruennichi]|uniref:RNA-dependent RNA polymerase n=1 Tax=Argiope bruennichi TaxID=94029 RepID=A0A8T0DYE6_ARGBR|nr:putative RNA-dependent RNA polymerase SHL2 like protein [Argiope bruennichi]
MRFLSFRVIFYPAPSEKPIHLLIENTVRMCGYQVIFMEKVESLNKNYAISTKDLDCVLYVHASDGNTLYKDSDILYTNFSQNWCSYIRNVDLGIRPMLQFYRNQCFSNILVPVHSDIEIESVEFGVYPKSGEFISYAYLEKSKEKNKLPFTADFTHDVKELKIIHSTESKQNGLSVENKVLIIPYKHIRNIIVDNNLLSCLRRNCRNIPVQYVAIEEKSCAIPQLPLVDWQHFGCVYMMTDLLVRNSTILHQDENTHERLRKVSTYCLENGDCLESALRSVRFIADSGRFVNLWDAIDLFYSNAVSEGSKNDFKLAIPPKCRLIRRITMTPTKMYLWPADLMCENRILRNFDSDYVIRVSFRDDDLSSLNFRLYWKKTLEVVIEKCITKGFVIGSRHYEFVAWSSSQLREHGVTMYAKDTLGRSAMDIIRWTEMNPLTTMNIPKCLARIGQCFSQTESVCHVPLDENHIVFAKDIKRGRNPTTGEPYCFSTVLERSLLDWFKSFRVGAGKLGLETPIFVDKDIVFLKEQSSSTMPMKTQKQNLEIAKKSKPLALRLNRPLIAILNDRGVPNSVFLKLQEQMIRKLISMLLDEQEAVSLSLGHIVSLHKHFIGNIKRKASIEIDPDYGRNMFGVLDETGKLKYGQVFVQYSKDISSNESTPDDTKILKDQTPLAIIPDTQDNSGLVKHFLEDSNPQEIAKFFRKYVENDAIGKIAYAHLAFADKHSIDHPTCLKIAKKHSFAVDFAKTGYFERLNEHEIPDLFPDFMDKFWQKKYKSKKALGKMFRICKDFESENEEYSLKYSDIQIDSSLIVDGWEKYEEAAISSRNAYNTVLKTILETYGISHETEAFGGSFLTLHERFRERRDRADIAKIVNKWLLELISKTREQFFSEFASDNIQTGIALKEYLKKASAWYMVTYRKECPEFLSFPWAVSDVLANVRILKYETITKSLTPRFPLIEEINAFITHVSQNGSFQNLPYRAISCLHQLKFTCDRSIIEKAISVLIKWAEEEHILSYKNCSNSEMIPCNVFIFHILSTAMYYGYLSNSRGIKCPNPSSAAFCLCFFSYLRWLRFLTKEDIKHLFPAEFQDIKVLSKRASTELHNIALTGKFRVLSHSSCEEMTEIYEMQPVSVDRSIFGRFRIPMQELSNASRILKNYTKVDSVVMREDHLRRKVIVTAKGKAFALQRLKDILNKNESNLKKLFIT